MQPIKAIQINNYEASIQNQNSSPNTNELSRTSKKRKHSDDLDTNTEVSDLTQSSLELFAPRSTSESEKIYLEPRQRYTDYERRLLWNFQREQTLVGKLEEKNDRLKEKLKSCYLQINQFGQNQTSLEKDLTASKKNLNRYKLQISEFEQSQTILKSKLEACNSEIAALKNDNAKLKQISNQIILMNQKTQQQNELREKEQAKSASSATTQEASEVKKLNEKLKKLQEGHDKLMSYILTNATHMARHPNEGPLPLPFSHEMAQKMCVHLNATRPSLKKNPIKLPESIKYNQTQTNLSNKLTLSSSSSSKLPDSGGSNASTSTNTPISLASVSSSSNQSVVNADSFAQEDPLNFPFENPFQEASSTSSSSLDIFEIATNPNVALSSYDDWSKSIFNS